VTRILVLPGIGDIYWIAVALEGFARRHGLTDLELTVWDFDGRRRGQDFVERIPFVRSGGYYLKPPHPAKMPEFRQSYLTGEQSVFPGLFGFDYYLAVNGALRLGRTVEETLDVECRWHFPLRRTPAEQEAELLTARQYGPYILAHFSDFGIFKPWVKAWGLAGCARFCQDVHKASGATVLLTGCAWDLPFAQAVAGRAGAGTVCLAGETDPDTFYGILHGALGIVGWPGGNTILGASLRKPTLIGWSQAAFSHPGFYRTSCPPDVWQRTYHAITVELERPFLAARRFIRALEDGGQVVAA